MSGALPRRSLPVGRTVKRAKFAGPTGKFLFRALLVAAVGVISGGEKSDFRQRTAKRNQLPPALNGARPLPAGVTPRFRQLLI